MKKFSEWLEVISESHYDKKHISSHSEFMPDRLSADPEYNKKYITSHFEFMLDRLSADPELEHIKGPFAISKERAEEIYKEGKARQKHDKICTKEENDEIKRVWFMMPDRYSWMDALYLIMAKGDVKGNLVGK